MVRILVKEGLGLFWAVFDDLILLFMYSPPHERALRSHAVCLFLAHAHFFMQTHAQIHIYLVICYHFCNYHHHFL